MIYGEGLGGQSRRHQLGCPSHHNPHHFHRMEPEHNPGVPTTRPPHLPQRGALAAGAAAHTAQHGGELGKQHQLQQLDAHAQRLHMEGGRGLWVSPNPDAMQNTVMAIPDNRNTTACTLPSSLVSSVPPSSASPPLAPASHERPHARVQGGSELRAQARRGPPGQSQDPAQRCQACGS